MQHTELQANPTPTVLSVPDRVHASALLERRAPTGVSSRRVITIVAAHLPASRAQLLAWDVVPQGQHDISTFLFRGPDGDYFLCCRSGNRPDEPAEVVPLSPLRAAAWFDAHPTHFADRDVLL